MDLAKYLDFFAEYLDVVFMMCGKIEKSHRGTPPGPRGSAPASFRRPKIINSLIKTFTMYKLLITVSVTDIAPTYYRFKFEDRKSLSLLYHYSLKFVILFFKFRVPQH